MSRKVAFLFFTALFLFLSRPVFADRFLFEAKFGHFRPFLNTLRELYDNGWDDYQFEASYSPFECCNPNWWKNFFVWGSYSFIFNRGFTFTGLDDTEINIHLNAFSLGLKYIQPLPWHFDIYGSVGGRYLWVKTRNSDETVEPWEKAQGLGGVLGGGLLFYPAKLFVVDLYTNFMFKHFGESHFESNGSTAKSLDVSGVTIGVGAGFRF